MNNMWLNLASATSPGMGENSVPYFILHGARDWNGRAWTLIHELRPTSWVAILGLGLGASRTKVGGAFAPC